MAEKKSSLIGTVFQDEKSESYTILEEMKPGAQGFTYLVEDGKKQKFVLKAIFEFDPAKEDQIRRVMECREKRKNTFLKLEKDYQIYYAWPLRIVKSLPGKYHGGYIMDYFPLKDCVNYESIENDDGTWDFAELCRVSVQLCRGLSGFHNAGYCYKDVSRDNIQFDMQNKKLYIIDLDNVSVVDKKKVPDVWGTPGFMAPEIQRKEKYPDEQSDFFSIAVVLFYIWGKGHPFDGGAYPLDLDEYMCSPVFIFHPTDKSNSAETENGDFDYQIYWWNALPGSMRELFTKAFVDKLESRSRISVTQWITGLNEIQEHQLMKCPSCGKMIARDAPYCAFCGTEKKASAPEIPCPKCGRPVDPEASECGHCHASLIKCPHCHALNEKGASLCVNCKKALRASEPVSYRNVMVMEVREDGTIKKRFSAEQERSISGKDLSQKLEKYPEALRFEIYDDKGKKRMVLRNQMPYLNWTVVTNENDVLQLAPGRIAAIDKVKKITLERGVSLTFNECQVKE